MIDVTSNNEIRLLDGCPAPMLTSVTNSGGSVSPVISRACLAIGGLDVGRVN
jgi:hypothetical protein